MKYTINITFEVEAKDLPEAISVAQYLAAGGEYYEPKPTSASLTVYPVTTPVDSGS